VLPGAIPVIGRASATSSGNGRRMTTRKYSISETFYPIPDIAMGERQAML
jgi:hypothetical protein